MEQNSGSEPFWKRRAKHGRDKLFANAELLWKAACNYFEWCDENPWIKKDWVGKDAEEVERPVARPYTLSGLCLYLGVGEAYFRQFKSEQKKCPPDFSTVIDQIYSTIETQQFEGAAVGAFNANIISRKLGLADKQETKVTSITVNQPDPDDEDDDAN